MIRKSVKRFSLATNAERVCAEIMPKQSRNGSGACLGQRRSGLSAEVTWFADAGSFRSTEGQILA
jgi:hypothetical protein